ncbi:hypothetical protein JXB37_03915 [candidate division WOR-3 bacterium]|nr:hypothetical protein [candidate division WOR-3 bacterium]
MPEHRSLVGIRREDKNRWERRAPLTPGQVATLRDKAGLDFLVQSSDIRVFPDDEYREAGADVAEDLANCDLVLGVKEMPAGFFRSRGSYCFFAHVIKGQRYNMGMLARLLELDCNLFDYEKMTEDDGRRLVFFGRYAGLAGAVDTLCGLGLRLAARGLDTPFAALEPAHRYGSVAAALKTVAGTGQRLRREGIPPGLAPLVIGVAGYGHVGRGALEVLDALGAEAVEPEDVPGLVSVARADRVYRTVYREQHLAEPLDPGAAFELQEYYDHPDRYRGAFEDRLPYLTVLLNCIYWDRRYPRLVTRDWLRGEMRKPGGPRLLVIGDISCDVGGAIEANVRVTDPGEPFYAYDPATGTERAGVGGPGVVVMATDNLPCEFPADASEEFGRTLVDFVPRMARVDFAREFEDLDLPGPLRRALIVHRGRLTPDHAGLVRYLEDQRS